MTAIFRTTHTFLFISLMVIVASCAKERTPLGEAEIFGTDNDTCGIVFENKVYLNAADLCGNTIPGNPTVDMGHFSAAWADLAGSLGRSVVQTGLLPGIEIDNLWFGTYFQSIDGKVNSFVSVGPAAGDSIIFQQQMNQNYWQDLKSGESIYYTSVYTQRSFSPEEFYAEGVRNICGEYVMRQTVNGDYFIQAIYADGTPNPTGRNYDLNILDDYLVGTDGTYNYYVVTGRSLKYINYLEDPICNSGISQYALVEYIALRELL